MKIKITTATAEMSQTKIQGLFLACLMLCLSGCGNGSGDDVTYVAIGASDAVGIGATPVTNGYVFRIRDKLQDDGVGTDLKNLGIPGAKIGAMRDIALPEAIRFDPDLVTIFAGANDLIQGESVSSFQDNLDKMIAELQEKTDADIIIGDLPDLTRLPKYLDGSDGDVTSENVAAYNQAIRSVASRYGLTLVRLSQDEPSDKYTSEADGFHPNDRGYERIANLYYEVIRPLYVVPMQLQVTPTPIDSGM